MKVLSEPFIHDLISLLKQRSKKGDVGNKKEDLTQKIEEKNMENLSQTEDFAPNMEKDNNVGDKQSIVRGEEVLTQILSKLKPAQIYVRPVTVTKNRVRRGNKAYHYIRKRIDLPPDFNDERAVVFSRAEFMEFLESVAKALGLTVKKDKLKELLEWGE